MLAGGIAMLQASALFAGASLDRGFLRLPVMEQAKSVLLQPLRVTKVSDQETVVAATFAVRRQQLFEAMTRPEHLMQWMGAAGMTLQDAHVDPHAGGSFRFVFQRQSGREIEVRGAYRTFDPPGGFSYLESYDFSPLQIEVTTQLEDAGDETRFTQTLRYGSTRERDEDFEPVATSSREAYARLGRYLTQRAP